MELNYILLWVTSTSWKKNIISLPLSSWRMHAKWNSLSAAIDKGYTTPCTTCTVHKWILCEVSSGNENCGGESCSGVPRCGCGSTALKIKRGGYHVGAVKCFMQQTPSPLNGWSNFIFMHDLQPHRPGKLHRRGRARYREKRVECTLFSIWLWLFPFTCNHGDDSLPTEGKTLLWSKR